MQALQNQKVQLQHFDREEWLSVVGNNIVAVAERLRTDATDGSANDRCKRHFCPCCLCARDSRRGARPNGGQTARRAIDEVHGEQCVSQNDVQDAGGQMPDEDCQRRVDRDVNQRQFHSSMGCEDRTADPPCIGIARHAGAEEEAMRANGPCKEVRGGATDEGGGQDVRRATLEESDTPQVHIANEELHDQCEGHVSVGH
mmetsp:Transcript_100937/g.290251  ORF Transcript_100937/g.290251 Transcript_100937/m.290251 type:complete len:200 (+) Transcript_100937:1634-2233(+)